MRNHVRILPREIEASVSRSIEVRFKVYGMNYQAVCMNASSVEVLPQGGRVSSDSLRSKPERKSILDSVTELFTSCVVLQNGGKGHHEQSS